MNENLLGKTQAEVEDLVNKQSSSKQQISWDSYYKKKDSPILLEELNKLKLRLDVWKMNYIHFYK